MFLLRLSRVSNYRRYNNLINNDLIENKPLFWNLAQAMRSRRMVNTSAGNHTKQSHTNKTREAAHNHRYET